jgi:hypothetical protein
MQQPRSPAAIRLTVPPSQRILADFAFDRDAQQAREQLINLIRKKLVGSVAVFIATVESPVSPAGKSDYQHN